jgi:DNA mismatch endonuclease (patch repair protein)
VRPASKRRRTAPSKELSDRMRRIKSKNTRPEILVRRAVRALGYRYGLHSKQLPGRPDLTINELRKAIFVNGCFWHQHSRCRLRSVPKRNLDYWLPKFQRTKLRDRSNRRDLRRLGWDSLVVWECRASKPSKLLEQLQHFLNPRRRRGD